MPTARSRSCAARTKACDVNAAQGLSGARRANHSGRGVAWSGVVEDDEVRRPLAAPTPSARPAIAGRYFTSKVMFAFTRYSTIRLSLTTPSKFLIQMDLTWFTVLPASETAR